jgi:protein TonB
MAYSYSVGDQAQISQRSLAFILVVSIHALFFWVLSSGLGAAIVRTVTSPSQTTFIDDLPETDARPPPQPQIEQSLPVVPMPDIDIAANVDGPAGNSISVAPRDPPAAQALPPVQPLKPTSVRTAPSATGRGARAPLPEYPPAARRAGEAGTVTLNCYVSEAGKCGEVSVVTSSGFERLDEAALAEVQRNWRFVPARENGKPVAAWHTFAITFRLND